jgi:RNA polymerase sigma-70 factor (ECF subfamily)
MNEIAGTLAGGLVKRQSALEREFDIRLPELSALAFRVAYSVLRHRQDAEDIAQDALVKAYSTLRQLRELDRLRAWLVRMTWRMAIDRQESDLRRSRREQSAVNDMSRASAPTSEDIALSAERSAQLWKAIDGLSDKLRTVVILASIHDHNLVEVASVLGVPEGTVKSRLFEARRHLRERLK